MYQAASTTGVNLCGGGYRDHQRQVELRRAHCGTSHFAVYEMPPSQCSPPTARPGTSRHEVGLAVDLTCDGALISGRGNQCYRWLATNAGAYGLHELAGGAEPWHWSVDGE
jgi:LAS superfamily LD-carboxypeptidase LdcB